MRCLPEETDEVTLLAEETAWPKIEAPCSRACPVRDWTRWRRLSRDLAGLLGALVVLEPGLRLRERSPLLDDCWVGGGGGGAYENREIKLVPKLNFES